MQTVHAPKSMEPWVEIIADTGSKAAGGGRGGGRGANWNAPNKKNKGCV